MRTSDRSPESQMIKQLATNYKKSLKNEPESAVLSRVRLRQLRKQFFSREQEIRDALQSVGREASINAIKELTLVEVRVSPLQPVGSATLIPLFLRAHISLWPSDDAALCEWIKEVCDNPYVPFGGRNREYSSWAEKKSAEEERQAKKKRLATYLNESNEFKTSVKKDLSASKATRDLPAAIRRGDVAAIKSLLEKGADTNQVRENFGSLQALATENERPLVVEFLQSINEV